MRNVFKSSHANVRTLFSWVHVSDLHFGHGDESSRLDQQLVLNSLRNDIQTFESNNLPRPNAIFVTGDVAFSGNVHRNTEYEVASAWLKSVAKFLDLDSAQIFIVPGNHDVQRDVSKNNKNAFRLLESLRAGHDKVDNVLNDKRDRALLAARMKNYLKFATEFGPPGNARLFWTHRIHLENEVTIRLVGLNTALLCADDTDNKKLELGNLQLVDAYTALPIEPNELVLVLSHHPFDWLRDGREALAVTGRYAHIHLCGHIHEAQNERFRSGGGQDFVRIISGAAHDYPIQDVLRFGYSFGAICDTGNLLVRVWPRIWSPKNHDFRVDVDNTPEGKTFAEHELKLNVNPPELISEGFDETVPFEISDFKYDLPFSPSSSRDLVPLPCTFDESIYADAFTAISNEIFKYFEALQEREYFSQKQAWQRACLHVSELLMKRKLNPKEAREAAIHHYSAVTDNAPGDSMDPLQILITGDTGAGKTTLARNLAQAFGGVFIDLRDYSPSGSHSEFLTATEREVRSPRETLTLRRSRILTLDALDKMVPGATHQTTTENLRLIRLSALRHHVTIITARTPFFRTHREEQLRDTKHVRLMPLDKDTVFFLSESVGLRDVLNAAWERSGAVRDLSRKPLLLDMLMEMLKKGIDVSHIEDQEDLFAQVIDLWLTRDAHDAIIPSDLRLKFMQCLALHSLSTGGSAISYATIDSLIKQMFSPATAEQVERFNTDIRVCGFLKRLDQDQFEFQHAAFYEYCVARSVFEDLKQGDVVALESHPFTEEIVTFITERARKAGKTNDLMAIIKNAWRSALGSTARVNLMKLYTALNGNCDELSLDNLVIEKQNLDGIRYSDSMTLVFHNVTFRECDFSGADFNRIRGERWIFESCHVERCKFRYARFESSDINHTRWIVDSTDVIYFSVCNWRGGTIEAASEAVVTIQGGIIADCILASAVPIHDDLQPTPKSSLIRFASLENINVGQSMSTWRIEMCSVDSPSLYAISSLKDKSRPSMSAQILNAVRLGGRDPQSVKAVSNPHVRVKSDVDQPQTIYNNLSKSQRRKLKRQIKKTLGILDQ